MRDDDRKLAWAAVIVLAVLAGCFAWYLFVGPADHGPYYASHCEKDCEIPWFRSAVAWTCIFTGVLTVSSGFMWYETRRLASNADAQASDIKDQLAIARDDFTSTHRPWISAKVSIKPPGIVIDQRGATFTIVFDCLNHGSSPAIGSSINAKLHMWHPMRPEVETLRTICREMHAPVDDDDAWGTGMMPNVNEGLELTFIYPRQLLDMNFNAGRPVLFWLAGCVDYGFSFGEPLPHQTSFIYYIGKAAQGGPGITPIAPTDTHIPHNGIYFKKCMNNGAFFVT